jgi:hypothetical protein
MQMCGRIYSEQAGYVQRIFDNLFGEVVVRFVTAFRRALPEVPEADRAWRIHFCVGAMIHTMSDSEKLKRFSNGICDPSDTEVAIEQMVRFCAAGLRAGRGGLCYYLGCGWHQYGLYGRMGQRRAGDWFCRGI